MIKKIKLFQDHNLVNKLNKIKLTKVFNKMLQISQKCKIVQQIIFNNNKYKNQNNKLIK